jgi:hypothetical protein
VIPEELQKIFDTCDEDDYSMYVTGVENDKGNFKFSLTMNFHAVYDEEERFVQNWLVEAINYRHAKILFEATDSLYITEDHPLLWEFTDLQCQLYFEGACKDPRALFYDLYIMHRRLFEENKNFDINFNEEASYFQPFQFTGGLLCKGSKKLMLEYAKCLERNGMGYSIIGERMPVYFDGKEYVEEATDLKVLLLGQSYVVARAFLFSLINQ